MAAAEHWRSMAAAEHWRAAPSQTLLPGAIVISAEQMDCFARLAMAW
jgi:hypothetical protein